MKRRKTTGRFDTREELEQWVRHLYYDTSAKQAQIARACRVSETTVANILKKSSTRNS